jgi:S-adenosylmethionine:diacylglycerol 3-amino-3-carboxypropyl transferase
MTDTKPEALRLADWCDLGVDPYDKRAAVVLRRQHEEIKCEERRFSELWEQFAALDKTNQELLEALKAIVELHDNTGLFSTSDFDKARAAIAKAEESK